MNDSLFAQTLELLRTTQVSVPEIARATGLKLRWLQRLRSGDFDDPGVNKIEILHRYLMGLDRDRTTADAPMADAGKLITTDPLAVEPSTVDGKAA